MLEPQDVTEQRKMIPLHATLTNGYIFWDFIILIVSKLGGYTVIFSSNILELLESTEPKINQLTVLVSGKLIISFMITNKKYSLKKQEVY